MGRSFLMVLLIIMLGITIGMAYFWSTRAEGATPGECAVLVGANPSIKCDSSTVVSNLDKTLGITDSVSEAKAYLKTLTQDLRNSAAPPTDPSNIDRLNNTFAVCSAKFLKAYQTVYGKGSAVIVSAYRDGPSGANRRAGGAPNSKHTHGLALDINPKGRGSYQTLWDFAKKNPGFAVCFPYLSGDRPHMGFAGGFGGEAAKCKAQGVKETCPGAPEFDHTPQYSTPSDLAQNFNSSQSNMPDLGNLGSAPSSPGSYGTPSPQQLAENISNGEQTLLDNSDGIINNDVLDYTFFDEEQNPDTNGDNDTYGDEYSEGGDIKNEDIDTAGEYNQAECSSSGLFGTSLFKTCDTNSPDSVETRVVQNQNQETEGGIVTRFVQNPVSTLMEDVPFFFFDNNERASREQNALVAGNSTDVFYSRHTPQDTPYQSQQTEQQGSNVGSYTFSAGDTYPVTREVPSIFGDSMQFAGLTSRLGSYYGLVHGASPLIPGGVPRIFSRFGSFKSAPNVYNSFSI